MCLRMGLRVAGNGGQELLAVEGVEPGLRRRLHGCRSRDIAEQGDLAEEVRGAGGNDVGAGVDRQLATADDVEAVADVARANDDVPLGDVDLDEVRGVKVAPLEAINSRAVRASDRSEERRRPQLPSAAGGRPRRPRASLRPRNGHRSRPGGVTSRRETPNVQDVVGNVCSVMPPPLGLLAYRFAPVVRHRALPRRSPRPGWPSFRQRQRRAGCLPVR